MKRIIAALVLTLSLCVCLCACKPEQNLSCSEHIDGNSDSVCDICGEEVKTIREPCEEHMDSDGDSKCDSCGADVQKSENGKEYTLTFESEGNVVGTLKINNGDSFEAPALDRGEEYILLGWKDKATGVKISENTFVWTEDTTLVAVWDTVWSSGF